MDNNKLVDHVFEYSSFYIDGKKRDDHVLEAMRQVDRRDYLPDPACNYAYDDTPLPIGQGQTCSQPSMVACMLDQLEIFPGAKILEIGSGCGYAASIAAVLTGEDGKVYASEIIPQLFRLLKSNTSDFDNLVPISGDGSRGFAQFAPFDRIFLSAGVQSSNFKEEILLKQLKDGGILLYPETFGNMYKVIKHGTHNIERIVFRGVSFVPLKGKNS